MSVSRKKKSKKPAAKARHAAGAQAAVLCFGIVFSTVLLFSCFSFNIADWPSQYVYPHNDPPANWCGSVGSFCAYYLLYYAGPGVFLVLLSTIAFMVMKLLRRPLDQPFFRSIGLGLLTVATSTSYYCLWPDKIYTFPFGSGGVLGVTAASFLRHNFAALGTFILIAAVWLTRSS